MKILGLGDNVCDVYIHKEVMYPGGQALNVAVYSKMLGALSEYLGIFGDDDCASHVIATLDEVGVPRSRCRTVCGENGFARVSIEDGDRVFKGSNRGGIRRTTPLVLSSDDLSYISGFTFTHTTNSSYADDLLSDISRTGTLLSYDFSTQWQDDERMARVLPNVDVTFMSCGQLDEDEIWPLLARAVGAGVCLAAATRGSRGTLLFDGEARRRCAPKLVDAVDTLGAGDSFAAALLVSLGRSLERDGRQMWGRADWLASALPEAMELAAEFSAKTCLVDGAFGYGAPIPPALRYRMLEDAL